MKENIKISVVIPVYNREDCIGGAVDSVLKQTFPALEIIVVDDNSFDSTLKTLSDLYGENKKVKVFAQEKNRGPASARNRGIKEANGDYVAFLDSDDIWLPNKLEKQKEKIVEYGAKIISTNAQKVKAEHVRLQKYPKQIYPSDKDFFYNISLNTSSMVIKKDLLNNNFFSENMKNYEDWDLLVRITSDDVPIYNVNEILTISYLSSNSISLITKSKDKLDDLLFFIEKNKVFLKQNRVFNLNVYFYALKLSIKSAQFGETLRLILQLIRSSFFATSLYRGKG